MTPEIVIPIIKALDEIVEENPSLVDCGYAFEYLPKEAILAVPASSTAFANRSEVCENLSPSPKVPDFAQGRVNLSFVLYKDEKLDVIAREAVRRLINIAKQDTVFSAADDLGYTNYSPQALDAAAAFGDNYPRLQEIKKKYDPGRVFHKWFPIEPAA